MGWTSASLSQKRHDELKYEFVNCLRRDWWSNYRAFETCNSFYRSAMATVIDLVAVNKTMFAFD